jgi:hypothetical protein
MSLLLDERDPLGSCSSNNVLGCGLYRIESVILKSGEYFRVIAESGIKRGAPKVFVTDPG